MQVEISWVGPEAAWEVHRLTRAAFAGQGWMRPPSGALRETPYGVRLQLRDWPGVLASLGGQPVAAARIPMEAGWWTVRRLAVDPALQRSGIGRAVMAWVEAQAAAAGRREVRVGVRKELASNFAFYRHLGYRAFADRGFWTELHKPLR